MMFFLVIALKKGRSNVTYPISVGDKTNIIVSDTRSRGQPACHEDQKK
jgi:hypothetical protein